ncbi:MAG: hypothetical protein C5B52_07115 [Bacteroidetes bacterium]|nr:MAG: hypothetical protein C5B52_07115 [Bacteroidota bacterium]
MIKTALSRKNTLEEFDTNFLIDVYAKGPARVKEAINGLNCDELCVFPFQDKWSIKEIVFHLTESELFGSIRFRQTITKADSEFPYYDQDIWTKRLKYQQRGMYELEDALDIFTLLRKTNTRLLNSLDEEQWLQTGIHPEKGIMNLRQLLELYADHSERHIDQILARRRLFGRTLELPEILPKRLY